LSDQYLKFTFSLLF